MFLYGELSVVISAMAVWMDLKDASVDNGWILFFFYDRFPDPDYRKRAERWSDLFGRSGRAGASFGNPFYIPYDRRRRYQASVRTWRDHGAADSYGMYCLFLCLQGAGISLAILISTGGIRDDSFIYISI